MEDFFPKKNGKTASQIIAEAKASIKSDSGNCIGASPSPGTNARSTTNGLSGGRLLSTKRPFTPRSTERSRPLSTSLSFRNRDQALVILEESDDDSSAFMKLTSHASGSSESNSKRRSTLLQRSNSAHSKLPMLVQASERQQFRPFPSLGMKKRPQSSNAGFKAAASSSQEGFDEDPLKGFIHGLQKAQDDKSTAFLLEQIGQASRQDLAKHKKDLMTIAARHLSSDNPRILLPLAELLFLLTKEQQSSGSKTLVILASKLVFKLSKDDSNDSLFLSRRTLDLLLTALGHQCPTKDHETFMYAYGGLKFLTLNASISTYLSDTLGFLHLCLLHVKLLCEDDKAPDAEAAVAAAAKAKTSTNTSQVMFQVTTCLRHLCNDNQNCQKFLTQLQGLKVLKLIVVRFKRDVDVMCNVSRILSVLTASFDELFGQNCPSRDIIKALYEILSRHHSRRDIVVRVTFVLGNLAARGEEARLVIGRHPDTTGLLPSLLHQCLTDIFQGVDSSIEDEAALDFGSTGNGEDTAIKIIRVIANASIEPDTGSRLAQNESVVNELLEAVSLEHENLLLPALATLNNLSYYPITCQIEVYSRLRGLLLVPDQNVAAEAARVIGNLSRRREVRDCLLDDGFIQCTAHLLTVEEDMDRQFVAAFVGIIINLMSDSRLRPGFESEEGIQKCVDLLHSCLDTRDWELACLVCQAVWNYGIDGQQLSDTIDVQHLNELEDILVYLLEAYNDSIEQIEESEAGFSSENDKEYSSSSADSWSDQEMMLTGSRFCQVSLTLLKRILDDDSKKVELLIND